MSRSKESSPEKIMEELEARNAVPEEKKREAAEFLKRELSPRFRQRMHWFIRNGKDNRWFASYHYGLGQLIRNLLRENGFGEKELGIENLDFIYVELLERAVVGEEVDWK